MPMNAAEVLIAAGDPARPALVCGAERATYGGLREAVARAGSAWRRRGVLPGDRVAIMLPDGIDWVVAYLGAIWAGGVAVAVNPRIPTEDWQYIVREGSFRRILASSRDLSPPGPGEWIETLDEWLPGLARAATMRAEAMAPDDPCFWTHSSGSTGRPKAVMHAHRFARGVERVAAELIGVGRDDRLFASSKLFFAYPLGNSLFSGLKLGATVILDPQWPTSAGVAATVAATRPTVLFSVPSLYRNLLHEGYAPGLARQGLRACVSAGEALPPGLRDQWRRETGLSIANGFGASETLSLVLFNAGEGDALMPSPGVTVEAVNRGGGVPTRVRIRGDMVALGYWNRPDAQAAHFDGGAFVPNDLFEQTDDGRWRFAGREDSLVKISGRWIDLVALEERLAAVSPNVLEAAAVAVPDADGVAAVAFFYVPKPDQDGAVREALRNASDTLPHYQRPRWLRAIDELPRTATGKLQRRKLMALHVIEPGEQAGDGPAPAVAR